MRAFDKVRSLLIVLTVTSVFVLSPAETAFSGKPEPPPPPAEPDWEYIPEAGGWLDWNTGLVWGENTYDLFYSLDPNSYMKGSWDFVNEVVLPQYQIVTGFDDWRFPTTDEVSDAASKNYTDYAFPEGVNSGTYPVGTWTSGGNVRWRYVGDLVTGETHKTIQERSSINLTPVRRLFNPE